MIMSNLYENLTLADAFRDIADKVTAAPSVDLGRRSLTAPVFAFAYARTVEDVHAAAVANGSRVYRDGNRTYTDVANTVVSLRFQYEKPEPDRYLARPVDVTDELAGRDA